MLEHTLAREVDSSIWIMLDALELNQVCLIADIMGWESSLTVIMIKMQGLDALHWRSDVQS